MSFDVIAEGPDDRIGILPVAEAKILPPFTGVIPRMTSFDHLQCQKESRI